jgi:hypothetical protein
LPCCCLDSLARCNATQTTGRTACNGLQDAFGLGVGLRYAEAREHVTKRVKR